MSTPLTHEDLTRVLEVIKSNLRHPQTNVIKTDIQAGIDAITPAEKWPRFFASVGEYAYLRFDAANTDPTGISHDGIEHASASPRSLQWFIANRRELTEAEAHALLDKKPEPEMLKVAKKFVATAVLDALGKPLRDDPPEPRMMQANLAAPGGNHGIEHEWRPSCNTGHKCIPVAPPDLGKPELGDTVEHPQFPSALVICDAEQDANGTVGVLSNGLRLSLKVCSLTVTAKAKLRVGDVLEDRTHAPHLWSLACADAKRQNHDGIWHKEWELIKRGPENV